MAIYTLNADVLFVEAEGETILLDYNSGKYFGLKGAMHRIFEKLRAGASKDEMAAAICQIYGIEKEAALNDIEAVLTQLDAAGLLTSRETP